MINHSKAWIIDKYWYGGWQLLELSRVTGRTVSELREIIEPDEALSDVDYTNTSLGIFPENN